MQTATPRLYLTQVAKAIASVIVSFTEKAYRLSLLLVVFGLERHLSSQTSNPPLPVFWTNIYLGQLRVMGQLVVGQGALDTGCDGELQRNF